MNFLNTLCNKIQKSGMNDLILIVNGTYYFHSSKLVHVKVISDSNNSNSRVCFYNIVKNDIGMEQVVIPNLASRLLSELINPELFGQPIELDIKDDETRLADMAQIEINSELGFLIIESFLYAMAKKAVLDGIERPEFSTDAISMNAMAGVTLKRVFSINSLINYKRFFDTRLSSKIVNRILKMNKFYSIQKAFVPVFISIKGIFNPLLDDPSNSILQNSDLFKTTMDLNRVVERQGSIKAYMMTHKEVCQLLHLKNFMRFTPMFLYEVICGILIPNSVLFPSNSMVVIRARENVTLPKGLKSFYTIQDFHETEENLKGIVNDSNLSEDSKKDAREQLECLQTYRRSTTMELFCSKEYRSLINYASLPFDEKVSAADLSRFLADVKL